MKVENKAHFSPIQQRAYHKAVINEESLFIFGGFDGNQHHNSMHKFDLNSKVFFY